MGDVRIRIVWRLRKADMHDELDLIDHNLSEILWQMVQSELTSLETPMSDHLGGPPHRCTPQKESGEYETGSLHPRVSRQPHCRE